MNDALAHGRFFFMDIARDGIGLIGADDKPLPEPKTQAASLTMAQEYFDEWFPLAASAQKGVLVLPASGSKCWAKIVHAVCTDRIAALAASAKGA